MHKTNLGFIASQKFIAKEPDLTRTLVQAHVKATNEMASNPAIAIKTTIEQFKMTPEVATESTKNLFFNADSGPAFQDGLKALARMMVDAKMLDRAPDWARFIDTRFVA
jgi:ABC-type nitrate/sulfonate/bicarbonate transport system substrate-binding protein